MDGLSSTNANSHIINYPIYNSNGKLPYSHLQLSNNNSFMHHYPFNTSYQKPIYGLTSNLSTTISTSNDTPLIPSTSSRDLFQMVNNNNGWTQQKLGHQPTSEHNNFYRRHTENNLTLIPNKRLCYKNRSSFVNEPSTHWPSMHSWTSNNNPSNINNNAVSTTAKRCSNHPSLPHSVSYGDFSLNGSYFPPSSFIGPQSQTSSSTKLSNATVSTAPSNSSIVQTNILSNQQSRFIPQSMSQIPSINELPMFFRPMLNKNNLCATMNNSVNNNHAQLSSDMSRLISYPSDLSTKTNSKMKQRVTQRIIQEILNLKQKCPTMFAWEIQQRLLQNGICTAQNLPSANAIHRVLRDPFNTDMTMRLNSDLIDTKPNITTVMQALLDNFNPMNTNLPIPTFIPSSINPSTNSGNFHSESSSRSMNSSATNINTNLILPSSSVDNIIGASPLTIYLSPSPSPSIHTISDSETSICDPDTECSICLCSYKNGQEIHILSCTHEFHSSCLKQWIKKNNSCPICRRDITDQSQFITILI
ncbi:unnamed protein product [Didymodactylos carnosus]|uniref:RING-type domain-containing protein n=2 Tax=Didymodactylos carnosus TaxID=1234261 RepID=A0A813TGH7_9BILA|nr:unnamed protein product [Didymodactylos carnosus]CAF3596235.1 unnamed protein product [Didymodactylos carnosus]